MKNSILILFLLISNYTYSQVDSTKFFPIGMDSVRFAGVYNNYPNAGQQTWYYQIKGKPTGHALSHTNLLIPSCIESIVTGGKWITRSKLSNSSNVNIGNDGSDPNRLYGVKFDTEVSNNTTINIWFTLSALYSISSTQIKTKSSNNWETGTTWGPDCIALPVELIMFEGYYQNDKGIIDLEWSTAQEINNKGFDIERSSNGIDFHTIGFKPGKGNINSTTSYNYTDSNPLIVDNYYRLKQLDDDGTYAYSKTVIVSLSREVVHLWPNPSRGLIHVDWSNYNAMHGEMELILMNTTGQIILSQIVSTANNPVIHVDAFTNGMYYLKLKTSDGKSFTEHIVLTR